MEVMLVVLGFLVLVLIGVIVTKWHHARAREMLEGWARQSGVQILKAEYRSFFRGPYFWTSSKGQTVYEVWVRDESGRDRHGYVRCGGYFLGMWSDHAEAMLDK